jgi:cyclohexanecarboxylate-CoA ligase
MGVNVANRLVADGGLPISYPATLWGLLRQSAQLTPERVVIADGYGRTLSTSQLYEMAGSVAGGLLDRGVDPASRVSWQLPTILESVVLVLALARLGVVQNPLTPVLRERELEFITGQMKTDVIVVPNSWRGFDHLGMAQKLPIRPVVIGLNLEHPPGAGEMRLPIGDKDRLPPEPLEVTAGTGTRWIYFSSGTTGNPKGVCHSDASIMASASGMTTGIGFGLGDVYPIAWPISHIGGGTMLTTALVAGTRLVLFDNFDRALSPYEMAAHDPTYLGTATPFFRAFIDAQLSEPGRQLFPHARRATFGGAPLPESLHDEVLEVLGIEVVMGAWGLTEFPIATAASVDDSAPVLRRTVGRPSPGVSVRVGEADGSGVSPNGEGELCLRGPQRLIGYLDESLNVEAFDSQGWFRTGDLGSIDEAGNVRITGRLKDVIITNAENISAQEVEDVVRTLGSVADVAIVGLPDQRTVERVCAVVVIRDGEQFDSQRMIDVCTANGLARYKHPEQVEIVDALPRDAMGKVQKDVLRALVSEKPA